MYSSYKAWERYECEGGLWSFVEIVMTKPTKPTNYYQKRSEFMYQITISDISIDFPTKNLASEFNDRITASGKRLFLTFTVKSISGFYC